jgi:DNA-binding response OmpR family regulator
VEKSDFLRGVWNIDGRPETNFLQVHFSRLKQKLAPTTAVRIETVHGRGYRLVTEGQSEEPQLL